MKHIIINRTDYDLDRDEFRATPVASFTVDETGVVAVEFGEENIPLQMTVLDVEADRTLSFEDDPLRWVELLPGAYRSGDYTVAVGDEVRPHPRVVSSAAGPAVAVAGLTAFDVNSLG